MKKIRNLLVTLFVCLSITNSLVFANDEVTYCVGENKNLYFNEKYLSYFEDVFLHPVMCGIGTGIFFKGLDSLNIFPVMLKILLQSVFGMVIFYRHCLKNIEKEDIPGYKMLFVMFVSLSVTLYRLNYLVNRDMSVTE